MKEWWWTRLLIENGHRFEHGEWRCADCRRRVVDLLAGHDRCQSPTSGSYVFVGGPFDGEWQTFGDEPPRVWKIALPQPPPVKVDGSDSGPMTAVSYDLQRHSVGRKTMLRYVFNG